ncbi:MAG: SufD family Fe-S cluster assembly protein [Clostridium sp.]|nr:SufD family Fe-S cluster assembly protein [Clostridium sp.]MCI7442588.1 SufD family Fe-S cluster assembly protein [Clostridium sp.]
MNKITKSLISIVSDLDGTPKGAYNIREDGECAARHSSENIDIVPKKDKSGIDIIIKPNTKGETVYIPALITHENVKDLVYNDFYVGEGSDIIISAGCGVHNDGCGTSEHNGIHRFFIGKNAHVLYLEKHVGTGDGEGKKVINPETYVEIEQDGYLEMDTVQIGGVDSTKRNCEAILKEGAKIVVKEKIMTDGEQFAETKFKVELNGEDSAANLISRSVAKGNSHQRFISKIDGNTKCTGHSECDAIVMDNAIVSALPEVTANSVDASLIHEAAIGKIAGEQIIKLMTLGLTEEEAEARIIEGFME